jgi:putative membrane protein
MQSLHKHSNQEEPSNFLIGALAWHGSVTPRILFSVIVTGLYTFALAWIDAHYCKLPRFAVTPFEYTGAVLGLVLVFRTNSGHDRWWEARKFWGGIVNQSRNLLIMTASYGTNNQAWQQEMRKWIISFSFAAKESLRLKKDFDDLTDLLNADEITQLQQAPHMPNFVAHKIASLLESARFKQQLPELIWIEFEKQRSLLIDYIGGCERILKTPMPLVYAIKVRRFILIYLLLLPFSFLNEAGLYSPLIAILVAYPLLSLDRIGFELQNPFAIKNLSHLPLDTICQTIKNNGLALKI